jgi:hypothetical protein
MEILVSKYGTIFSDEEIGKELLEEVKRILSREDTVTLDFSEVMTMTTFNAKQVFGDLYTSLGPEIFFKRIIFRNASRNIVTIIKLGIQDTIDSGALNS